VEFAYKPEIWHGFFEVVALAAATVTGLLAVALSVNIRAIVGNPGRIGRAREALIALTVLLAASIFILIPEQGRVALGIELIVMSIVVAVVSLRLQAGTLRGLAEWRRRRWQRRLVAIDSAIVAIALTGVSLVIGRFGGLLWMIYVTLSCLVWSTYNAWNLTIRVSAELEEERDT
jgi:hypothetical protein